MNLRPNHPVGELLGRLAEQIGAVPAGGAGSLGGSITIRQAVPEPGTWAMMLLGFGAVGFAMRRRRRPALMQVA